jgi:methyl-accepting chemotaxis protein
MRNDDAISRRLEFIRLDSSNRKDLQSLAPLIDSELPKALDGFYKQIRAFQETKHFFGIDGHVERAKAALRLHWNKIVGGTWDDNHVSASMTIGSVHARFGLEPRWYIGGYALILDALIRAVMHQAPAPGWRRWFKPSKSIAHTEQVVSLVKAALLDIDLAMTAYLSHGDDKRRELSELAAQMDQKALVEALDPAIERLSHGDFSARIADPLPPELERLRSRFNTALDHVERAMKTVVEAGTHIERSASSLAETANADRDSETPSWPLVHENLKELSASLRQANSLHTIARDTARRARIDVEFGALALRSGMAVLKQVHASHDAVNLETLMPPTIDAKDVLDRLRNQIAEIDAALTDMIPGIQEQSRRFAELNGAITALQRQAGLHDEGRPQIAAHASALSRDTATLMRILGYFRIRRPDSFGDADHAGNRVAS